MQTQLKTLMALANKYKVNVTYIITAVLICCSVDAFCQGLYNGKIIDRNLKTPLSWVNIGIIGKDIGTVSNDKGDFKILLDEKNNQDTLRISRIGYQSLNFRVDNFRDLLRKNSIVQMEEVFVQLSEVAISNETKEDYVFGNTKFTNTMVFGFQSHELGNEIGTIISIEDGPVDIKSINVSIYKNKLKSFKYRLNIYDIKDGKPHKIIHNKNIIIECTTRKGLYSVDLSEYDIVAEGDIFVSLEWIEDLTEGDLFFSTTPQGTKSFTRHASQANWTEATNVSLGLYISAQY